MNGLWTRVGRLVVLGVCCLAPRGLAQWVDPPPDPEPAAVNAALQLDLFTDASLWDADAAELAGRLAWPRAFQTESQSGYRLYPRQSQTVLGCRPYSLAMYAADGKPTELSMIFANKGDMAGLEQLALVDPDATNEERRIARKLQEEAIDRFREVFERDADSMIEQLEGLFGDYDRQTMGQGHGMRVRVYRWDWRGHSFLLPAEEDEYLGLRIITTEAADNRGRARKTVSDGEMRQVLRDRVKRRENGDVIITQIPMVNQGPKGYCVPATWERVLRYMGMSADMYVLAMAGETGFGGGTHSEELRDGIHKFVRRNGRKMRSINSSLAPHRIDRYIDDGIPLMWTMVVHPGIQVKISQRTIRRQRMTDPETWATELADARDAGRDVDREDGLPHMCMIIGYNKETDELCISDSWGPAFAERWITVDEAEAISQGELEVIKP